MLRISYTSTIIISLLSSALVAADEGLIKDAKKNTNLI